MKATGSEMTKRKKEGEGRCLHEAKKWKFSNADARNTAELSHVMFELWG